MTIHDRPANDFDNHGSAGPSLVVVAHGSRDPRTRATIATLLDRVRELRPGVDVRLGHLGIDEPLLSDTLVGLGTGRAVLVPLLLSRGTHIKRDLPAALASAPRLHTRIAAPLGPHPLLVEVLYARLAEAGWRMDATSESRGSADAPAGAGAGAGAAAAAGGGTGTGTGTGTGSGTGSAARTRRGGAAVVLAAAGSLDPESAADTRRTAALLSERLGGVPVVPAYASAASPTVREAVRALAARGHHRTAVASYFTAPGHFATRSAAAAPWIAAAPLGAHPAMARLLLHRYDQARDAPYDTAHRDLASVRA
ncbi:sirohydrochlorin chelatase [Streptomyces sp. GMY02]|uniref:sirohydrochlorin chelatase n=1 Tax=Streptomyces sp. GMY02 TaxID=1333528 RepID=UPI001C2B97B9|nr:CbiX/SirB N-terminal domain-containing protein [Streptomyces sp. GMY02]QXE36935.1 sirohydrochlorin chelatase [Streptomyces sp. GMY02]